MKILITGGTGFVGQRLVKALFRQGHSVVIVTRNPSKAKNNEQTPASFVGWDYLNEDFPAQALKGVDAIVNLMGENISAGRWSDKQKNKIKSSRVLATQKLVKACEENLEKPLECFISGSAIGIYPMNLPKELNEDSEVGRGFLAETCKEWEEASNTLTKTKRHIISRTGVVLGPESGALNKLLPIFKLGAGGPIGNGKMVMSWIHIDDMVNALTTILNNDSYEGVYNLVSPIPCTNKDFTKAIAKAVKKPAFFPVPPLMLKIAFGEMSSIILDSQKVLPKNLLSMGFEYQHPEIHSALKNLMNS